MCYLWEIVVTEFVPFISVAFSAFSTWFDKYYMYIYVLPKNINTYQF